MKGRIFLLSCIVSAMLNSFFFAAAEKMICAEPTRPLTYKPLYIQDRISLHLSSLLYNSLVGTDANNELQPELLETVVPIRAGNGFYSFKLRSGVQWVGHDGDKVVVLKPFTAQDVVYTFEEITGDSIFAYVKDLFTDVSQISENEVGFELKKERAYLDQESVIRCLQFPIIPDLRGIDLEVSKLKHFRGQLVVGTGPFVMKEEVFGNVKLDRNRNFFRSDRTAMNDPQRLDISQIEIGTWSDAVSTYDAIAMPEGGSPILHLMTEIPLDILNDARANENLFTHPYGGAYNFTFIAYNCARAFSDRRLRLAFTHAFDRKEAFVNIYGDIYPDRDMLLMKDIHEIIHCPLSLSDIPIIQYDPQSALRLKEEVMADPAVRDDVKDEIKGTLNLLAYIEDNREDRICRTFATQVAHNLDIRIKLVTLSKAEWVDRVSRGSFEIAFGRVVFSREVNIIDSLFRSTSPRNFVRYKNSKIDALLEEYDRATHPEVRKNTRDQMAGIIAEDVPYTFLYRIPKYAAWRNDVLGGVEIHPYHFFTFADRWYMKPQK